MLNTDTTSLATAPNRTADGAVPPTIVRRLRAQGYQEEGAALAHAARWARWAPALCALSCLAATVAQSPIAFWAIAATAAAGAVLPNHPFDWLFNYGVRHVVGEPPMPRNQAPRRFACGSAVPWLVGAGIAFHVGSATLGLVLGTAFAMAAGSVALTLFCLPSFAYSAVMR